MSSQAPTPTTVAHESSPPSTRSDSTQVRRGSKLETGTASVSSACDMESSLAAVEWRGRGTDSGGDSSVCSESQRRRRLSRLALEDPLDMGFAEKNRSGRTVQIGRQGLPMRWKLDMPRLVARGSGWLFYPAPFVSRVYQGVKLFGTLTTVQSPRYRSVIDPYASIRRSRRNGQCVRC